MFYVFGLIFTMSKYYKIQDYKYCQRPLMHCSKYVFLCQGTMKCIWHVPCNVIQFIFALRFHENFLSYLHSYIYIKHRVILKKFKDTIFFFQIWNGNAVGKSCIPSISSSFETYYSYSLNSDDCIFNPGKILCSTFPY